MSHLFDLQAKLKVETHILPLLWKFLDASNLAVSKVAPQHGLVPQLMGDFNYVVTTSPLGAAERWGWLTHVAALLQWKWQLS